MITDKPFRTVALVVLVICVAGFLLFQQRRIIALRSEGWHARAEAANLAALLEESARPTKESPDATRLKRDDDAQLELLRLRNEVGKLRRQLQETTPTKTARTTANVAEAPDESSPDDSPVETLKATVDGRVGWNSGLVIGGWATPSGKRALVVLEPSPVGPGTVNVQTRIYELPDAALETAGLGAMRSNQKESNAAMALSPEQLTRLVELMRTTDGAEMLASPQVTTSSGRQAQVAVVENRTDPVSGNYTLGPVVVVVPTISADGQSVGIAVSAQINLPRRKSGN